MVFTRTTTLDCAIVWFVNANSLNFESSFLWGLRIVRFVLRALESFPVPAGATRPWATVTYLRQHLWY